MTTETTNEITNETTNEITNEMRIKNLTSEQASIILSIIDGTEFHYTLPYPYIIKREKKTFSGDVSWANEYIEYHYYVKYMGTEKTEIKFFDWVIEQRDLLELKAQKN